MRSRERWWTTTPMRLRTILSLGWKKWTMANPEHQRVICALVGTDNGKTSTFLLQNWVGYLGRKSIYAVHTYIVPATKAKHMCWEFTL